MHQCIPVFLFKIVAGLRTGCEDAVPRKRVDRPRPRRLGYSLRVGRGDVLQGKSLGSFEVLAPLGKGGMGEVYKAKDQKLGRDVAIKVLPEEFAKDAERVARFQREAKLLASLNHPNIATLYGLEAVERVRVDEFMQRFDGRGKFFRIRFRCRHPCVPL